MKLLFQKEAKKFMPFGKCIWKIKGMILVFFHDSLLLRRVTYISHDYNKTSKYLTSLYQIYS